MAAAAETGKRADEVAHRPTRPDHPRMDKNQRQRAPPPPRGLDRQSNVVIVGLKPSTDKPDLERVELFLRLAQASDVRIKDLRRLKAGKNSITSNIILISLASKSERDRVLNHCRHHGLTDEFEHVFAREDRSLREQTEFNEARKKAGRRNDELRADSLLDKPFRFVVHRRTGKVTLIDTLASRAEKRYVLRSETELRDFRTVEPAPKFVNLHRGSSRRHARRNGDDHIVNGPDAIDNSSPELSWDPATFGNQNNDHLSTPTSRSAVHLEATRGFASA